MSSNHRRAHGDCKIKTVSAVGSLSSIANRVTQRFLREIRIDDEPSIREVAATILESHGYKVLVAEDGPTGLALFARKTGQIAMVVTDLAMPGMDGLMLVRTLRRLEPGLKIIVSTGRDDDSNAAKDHRTQSGWMADQALHHSQPAAQGESYVAQRHTRRRLAPAVSDFGSTQAHPPPVIVLLVVPA